MTKHWQSTVVSELATVQHTRAAAFVLLLSVLLVVEGVSRANLYIGTPAGQWTGDLRIVVISVTAGKLTVPSVAAVSHRRE